MTSGLRITPSFANTLNSLFSPGHISKVSSSRDGAAHSQEVSVLVEIISTPKESPLLSGDTILTFKEVVPGGTSVKSMESKPASAPRFCIVICADCKGTPFPDTSILAILPSSDFS